jgi:hypothetical protein
MFASSSWAITPIEHRIGEELTRKRSHSNESHIGPR